MDKEDYRIRRTCCPSCNGPQPGITRRGFLQGVGGMTVLGTALTGVKWSSLALAEEKAKGWQRHTLVVKPILVYDTPQRKHQTSWRSWGGIQTEEDAKQEVVRIEKELKGLEAKADFPIESCGTLATAELCQNIYHHLEVHEIKERFRRSMKIGNVVFCAVDQIETRRLIWDAVKDKVNFFCDGRMSAEVLRILAACDSTSRKHYPNTLFGSGEAFVGPCTAKTTIYCANIAAGLMLAQFTRYLRQLPIDCDIQLNLLASELNVVGGR